MIDHYPIQILFPMPSTEVCIYPVWAQSRFNCNLNGRNHFALEREQNVSNQTKTTRKIFVYPLAQDVVRETIPHPTAHTPPPDGRELSPSPYAIFIPPLPHPPPLLHFQPHSRTE